MSALKDTPWAGRCPVSASNARSILASWPLTGASFRPQWGLSYRIRQPHRFEKNKQAIGMNLYGKTTSSHKEKVNGLYP
jgi:hypothetical protein